MSYYNNTDNIILSVCTYSKWPHALKTRTASRCCLLVVFYTCFVKFWFKYATSSKYCHQGGSTVHKTCLWQRYETVCHVTKILYILVDLHRQTWLTHPSSKYNRTYSIQCQNVPPDLAKKSTRHVITLHGTRVRYHIHGGLHIAWCVMDPTSYERYYGILELVPCTPYRTYGTTAYRKPYRTVPVPYIIITGVLQCTTCVCCNGTIRYVTSQKSIYFNRRTPIYVTNASVE